MEKKKKRKMDEIVNSIVVVSDLHCGCRLGLCPAKGVALDDGGTYYPSKFQRKLYSWWREFWDEVVEEYTRGEPYAIVVNGDALDGVHHSAVTQISQNLSDQTNIAYDLLSPIVKRCDGRYYHIRGTEAHVGKSGQEEERLARVLGAIPNSDGQYSRYVLWKYIGSPDRTSRPFLLNFSHHIGTTGSMAYETTAVMKELVEAYSEAGRWKRRPPDLIVRSHRHRYIRIEVPTANVRGISLVTPGWQGKTPFMYRLAGARQSEPQIGGVVIRVSEEGELYVRSWVRSFDRPTVER